MKTHGLDVCGENWTALYNLWNRQYWSRIWVIQELASSIIVGPMLLEKSVTERHERCLIGYGKHWIESKLYTPLGLFLTNPGPVVEHLFNITWTRRDGSIFGTPVDPVTLSTCSQDVSNAATDRSKLWERKL
jgi:hypothetical protein